MTTTTNTSATTKEGTISSLSYDITNKQKEVDEKNDNYLGAEEFLDIDFGLDENLDSSITGPLLDGTLGRCLSGSARSSNITATTKPIQLTTRRKQLTNVQFPCKTRRTILLPSKSPVSSSHQDHHKHLPVKKGK